jgi:hypothetical protein
MIMRTIRPDAKPPEHPQQGIQQDMVEPRPPKPATIAQNSAIIPIFNRLPPVLPLNQGWQIHVAHAERTNQTLTAIFGEPWFRLR